MGQLFETVHKFLTVDDWPIAAVHDGVMIETVFVGTSGRLVCEAHVDAAANTFWFYSIAPVTIPRRLRRRAIEVVNRVNWGMFLGSLELGLDDGVLRYRTEVNVGQGVLTFRLIKAVIYGNLLVMDQYLPELADVLGLRLPAPPV